VLTCYHGDWWGLQSEIHCCRLQEFYITWSYFLLSWCEIQVLLLQRKCALFWPIP
jgi:hypothetical protein